MTNNNIRFGVIGAGRIGKIHAANLTMQVQGAEVATIADIDRPAAEETAARLHIPVVVSDYHAILDDPSIGAVAICSSTDTHAASSSKQPRPASTSSARNRSTTTWRGSTRRWRPRKRRPLSCRLASTAASTRTSPTSVRWWQTAGSAICTSCASPAAIRLHRRSRIFKFRVASSSI